MLIANRTQGDDIRQSESVQRFCVEVRQLDIVASEFKERFAGGVAVVASLVPAIRASRPNPVSVLGWNERMVCGVNQIRDPRPTQQCKRTT